MAKTIASINPTTDNFNTWLAQTNALIDALATEIVTANSEANGSITTGNTFIVGIFGSNTIAVDTALRGGNVQASAPLAISSNVTITDTSSIFLGNSTVNAISNSITLIISDTSRVTSLDKDDFKLGTSAANITANSTELKISNSTTTAILNKVNLRIGSAAANAVLTNSALTFANSTVTFSLDRPALAEQDGSYWLNANGSWSTIQADINISGTPVNDQLAIWTNATTLEGNASLTWASGVLTAAGNVSTREIFANNITLNGAATTPTITFDTNDYIRYTKSTNLFDFVIGGTARAYINSTAALFGSAPTTETTFIEIGSSRSGDGVSHIDLIGDATYADYGLRIIRNGTASGTSQIIHRGTGNLLFHADESANIIFQTNSADRLRILNTGVVQCTNAIQAGVGYTGEAMLEPGADRSGYVSFWQSGTRQGYIGYSSGTSGTGRKISLVAENDHNGFNLTGTLSVSGTITKGSNTVITAGKHTIWVPAGSMTPHDSAGPEAMILSAASGAQFIDAYAFDTTTIEQVFFAIKMPVSWNEGTVTYQPVWTTNVASSGGVVWQIGAVAFGNDDTLNTAVGTGDTTATDTYIADHDCHICPESSSHTIQGSPTAGDYVWFRLIRATGNGSDTMAADAILLGMNIYYTVDAENDS